MQSYETQVRHLRSKVDRLRSQLAQVDETVSRFQMRRSLCPIERGSPVQRCPPHYPTHRLEDRMQLLREKQQTARRIRQTNQTEIQDREDFERQDHSRRCMVRDIVRCERENLSVSNRLLQVRKAIISIDVQLSK